MTALAADRNPGTYTSEPGLISLPMAASVTIYAGAMVAMDSSGYARPARASQTDKVIGVNFGDKIVNGTTAGAKSVTVRSDKIAWFGNSASTNAIAITDIGRDCFAADDQTVSLTDQSGTLVRAGKIVGYSSTYGVGVDFAAGTAKLVALTVDLADVSTASSAYVVSPIAGKVVKIVSALNAAITVADSALTTAIQPAAGGGFTAITGGSWTVAYSGSAIGDSDTATPTAANTVAVGSTLRVTTDGGSTTTAALTVTFLIAAA